MKTVKSLTIGVFFVAVVLVGCDGNGRFGPPKETSQLLYREHSTVRALTATWAACTTVPVQGGTNLIDCVLKPGTKATGTVSIDVDEADQSTTTDSCGKVTWSKASPNPAVTVALVTPSPSSTSCSRQDVITVKVARLTGQPQPSPSPGAIIYSNLFVGSDIETAPTPPATSESQEGKQSGAKVSMPGPGQIGSSGAADLQFYLFVYAPPALQVVDADSSPEPVISLPSTPSPLMIGQQIALAPQAVGGAITGADGTPLGPVTWSPEPSAPSEVVASYSPCSCPSVSPPVPLGGTGESLTISPTVFGYPPLVMYYLKGGTKTIEASAYVQLCAITSDIRSASANATGASTCGVNGSPIGAPQLETATVHYPITGTTASASRLPGTPYITGPPGRSTLQPCPSQPINECIWGGSNALQWQFSVTTPANGAGQIALAQLIEQTAGASVQSGASETWCTSPTASLQAETYWLDNIFPYPASPPPSPGPGVSISGGQTGTWNSQDSPNEDFPSDLVTGDNSAWLRDSFEDYFMYQATPTKNRPAIWVTLLTSTWTLSDSWVETPNPTPSASPLFAEGAVNGFSKSGVTATSPTPSTKLPVWSQQASNGNIGLSDPVCATTTPRPSPNSLAASRVWNRS